jgi:hypothetical protein
MRYMEATPSVRLEPGRARGPGENGTGRRGGRSTPGQPVVASSPRGGHDLLRPRDESSPLPREPRRPARRPGPVQPLSTLRGRKADDMANVWLRGLAPLLLLSCSEAPGGPVNAARAEAAAAQAGSPYRPLAAPAVHRREAFSPVTPVPEEGSEEPSIQSARHLHRGPGLVRPARARHLALEPAHRRAPAGRRPPGDAALLRAARPGRGRAAVRNLARRSSARPAAPS